MAVRPNENARKLNLKQWGNGQCDPSDDVFSSLDPEESMSIYSDVCFFNGVMDTVKITSKSVVGIYISGTRTVRESVCRMSKLYGGFF